MIVDTKTATLISPYGGKLVDLMAPSDTVDELKACTEQLSSIQISARTACDLELCRQSQTSFQQGVKHLIEWCWADRN